jgi:Lrp/AsnC family leucine-responsive transcriptional regulator
MDGTDRAILLALQADARISYQDLGAAVGLSPPAAYQRVRKLEEAGVITGYHAALDASQAGRPVVVYLRVRPGPSADTVRLLAQWRDVADVAECHHLAADGAYLLKLKLRSLSDAGHHLEAAVRAGCEARLECTISTVFERWTVPLAAPSGAVNRR